MSASSSSRPSRRGRCQPPPRPRLAAPPLPVAARVWSPVPGSPPSHRLSFPRATPRASQYPASCGRAPAYGRRRRAADRLRGRVPTGGRLRLVARLLRLPVRRLGHRPRRLPLARRGVGTPRARSCASASPTSPAACAASRLTERARARAAGTPALTCRSAARSSPPGSPASCRPSRPSAARRSTRREAPPVARPILRPPLVGPKRSLGSVFPSLLCLLCVMFLRRVACGLSVSYRHVSDISSIMQAETLLFATFTDL